jgi:sulfate transport system ATP-binding protein
MSVFENVAFGLRVRPSGRRPGEAEIRRKVTDLLKLVQLDWLGDRYPAQLSGGQRQRVALARALAVEPKVLLLDEPFGSLDAQVRQELRRWLRRLHDEIRVTSVFVTHDQEEALEVADRIVVMNRGQVEQIGTPQEVFDRPATPFVMGFLGNVNMFHGRVEDGRAHFGPLSVDYPTHDGWSGPRPAQGFARPYELDLAREASGDGFWATLRHVNTAGAVVKLELEDGETRLVQVETTRDQFEALHPKAGESLYVKPRQVRIFVAES